jgi:bacillithiol biosynthesis cysteine-adding enzyme BshC
MEQKGLAGHTLEQITRLDVECRVPDLFQDYVEGAPDARPFFASGTFGIETLLDAAERAASHPRDLKTASAILVRQQEALGADRAAARAAALAERGASAVVTGQQPDLFGGPLLVLYKALTARKLSDELQARRGRPVVPVFWVASDDHDFEEMRSVTLIDATGAPRRFRYAPRQEPTGQPASRIVLDDTIPALLDEVEAALPASPDREPLLALLRRCYRPGATLSGAFASMLSSLLPDLVLLDPADPALKALMAPVMSRELREASPTSRVAREVGARLEATGYREQVQVRPGFLNLFVLAGGERRALAAVDGSLEVRGLDQRLPLAEAERWLEKEPELWSPGALLRPLAQDLLLPTAAYVGGPAEIAYHAQIGPAYADFGIPRPVLVPRARLTLVEPAQARAMDAKGLTLEMLREDPERILARWARQSYPEVEAAFAKARQAVEGALHEIEGVVAAVDPTLRGAAEGARGRALFPLDALHEKTTRALKKREQMRTEWLRRTRDALFPGGEPQERVLGMAGLLARHGVAIIDEIANKMDIWARGPQVIKL